MCVFLKMILRTLKAFSPCFTGDRGESVTHFNFYTLPLDTFQDDEFF